MSETVPQRFPSRPAVIKIANVARLIGTGARGICICEQTAVNAAKTAAIIIIFVFELPECDFEMAAELCFFGLLLIVFMILFP
jgi:hypothetical protein